MSSHRRLSAYLGLAAATSLIGGCGECILGLCGGADAGPEPLVALVEVTAPTTLLTSLGATVQVQATATDFAGNTLAGTFIWTSSDEDIVTVNTSGLATAVANGMATIVAVADGVPGSVGLTVSQVVATIAVTPGGPLTLASVGATESLTAVANDGGGAVVAGVTFTWASDNEAAVTVAADGTVTAVANGVANITSSASGVTSNTVEVTVTL